MYAPPTSKRGDAGAANGQLLHVDIASSVQLTNQKVEFPQGPQVACPTYIRSVQTQCLINLLVQPKTPLHCDYPAGQC